ncbi:MAG: sodium:solute symporter [Verrucomicrobiota bacterium]|nr:sodium:solute symporter [Verrucomicrobiota bacterium]
MQLQSKDIIDLIILLIYFGGIVFLGLYVGRNNKSLEEYALGGRNIPWWAVLASIIAAETSAATFLGTPAEGFKERGFIYGQLVIGTILARVVIAYVFIKPYYDYKVQSVYEFLTVRFGTATKNMASGIFLISRVLGIGVRLYLGGVIFVVIWRYLFKTEPELIHYFAGILFVTVLTTIYTAVGGIRAVIYTDTIQAILMMGSALFAIFMILHNIPGGLETVSEKLNGFKDVKFFQTGIKPDDITFAQKLRSILETPYTIFAAFIASTFYTMATHGTDQDMVQRMLTAKDHTQSRRSLILSGFADIPIVFMFLSIGILLYVYYGINPDPMMPKAANEIFAHYIVNSMPVAVRGLIIAGVFATMMGSTSAALNALATSFTKDFYLPYINPTATEKQSIGAARWATVVFGIMMVLVGTLAAYAVLENPNITIIPLALGVLGYSYGAVLGVFLLGMLTKTRGNDSFNIVAMVTGMLAVFFMGKVKLPFGFATLDFGMFMPTWFPAISWPWWILIGSAVTFGLGALRPRDMKQAPFTPQEELERQNNS